MKSIIKVDQFKKYSMQLLIIFSFVILSIISIIVFLHTHIIFSGYDMQFHIKRIMELKRDIISGDYLPLYSFNYFHGSALMSMYPYLNLYPLIIILFIVHSFIKSYYYFFSLIIFISFMTSFYSSLKYKNSIFISYLFSLTYSMSSVFTMTMFTNGDLGIVTSLAFLPLVIFGFINCILYKNSYVELAVGISLMLYCQLASTFIAIGAIFLWTLINYLRINRNIVLNLIKALFLIILLTSLVWIPLIHLIILNNIKTVSPFILNGVSIKFFIKYTSITAMIGIIFSILLFKKYNSIEKQMFYISLFFILISSKLMPWRFITSFKIFRIFNIFQFTFRFLIIPQILLCYLFSVGCSYYILYHRHQLKELITSVLVIMIVLLQIFTQVSIIHKRSTQNSIYINNINDVEMGKRYIINNNKSVKYLANGYINVNDYYPKDSFSKFNDINKNLGISHNKFIRMRNAGYNTVTCHSDNYLNTLSLPYLYYNGEHLKIYMNNRLVRSHVNRNNMITVNNVKKGYYNIRIKLLSNIVLMLFKYILLLIGLFWLLLKMFNLCLIKRQIKNM